MDTRIERRASGLLEIVIDDDIRRVIGRIHEGSDRPDDITILPGGVDPSLLADLRGRRYAFLDTVAEAIGTHLEGTCQIT